jgi:hypothetical protein
MVVQLIFLPGAPALVLMVLADETSVFSAALELVYMMMLVV